MGSSIAEAADVRRRIRERRESLRGAYDELDFRKEEVFLLERQINEERRKEKSTHLAYRSLVPLRLPFLAWKQSAQEWAAKGRYAWMWKVTTLRAKRRVARESKQIEYKAR